MEFLQQLTGIPFLIKQYLFLQLSEYGFGYAGSVLEVRAEVSEDRAEAILSRSPVERAGMRRRRSSPSWIRRLQWWVVLEQDLENRLPSLRWKYLSPQSSRKILQVSSNSWQLIYSIRMPINRITTLETHRPCGAEDNILALWKYGRQSLTYFLWGT